MKQIPFDKWIKAEIKSQRSRIKVLEMASKKRVATDSFIRFRIAVEQLRLASLLMIKDSHNAIMIEITD